MSDAYTANEVAFVLGETVKAVKKTLDTGPVETTLAEKAGPRTRFVKRKDLFYLLANKTLQEELTAKARRELYQVLREVNVERVDTVRLGSLSVHLQPLRAEIDRREHALEALHKGIKTSSDGEAVIAGSGVEAHRIAALLKGGMSPSEIQEDYPSLTLEQIDAARAYAEVYPKPGRPYPERTLKRALLSSGLEELDDFME
ncbi:DUF433 domain-containing protein [Stenotrophomonas maltophilia]|uniref:DUF433 domain-containing protein n=1 Tax=Stenotrophomonas bentonitica TaxID=1450134 RepID=A0ABU9JQ94_9GAMM|nr:MULTISPECIES: DUF433 domain-containing protein [Stenotrophomonas]MBA0394529.1 DUF433 domain-containing protein [Stenotrophomonas maltophilia]PKH69557.1 DUF433 domain-containing protein [Stenotrophomonas sp. Betaine-02u-23]PKH74677.1 DUF433 domain-containing protein [Stenotrophomonas sp. Betaine-02u-21]PKH95578.1 DUF433 domain-containing protein [Stenotrophomonas sp. Bg11-02]QGL75380.1 DUF433 domain-containing protein [Stenotrophomonas maltophilia]